VKTIGNLFTLSTLIAITFLIGCAQRSDDGASGPVCDNGVCENGESAQSCPQDCDETLCDGDGVCEAGEDHASCPADCDEDENPPVGSDKWVCRGSFRGGKAYWACNPDFIAGAPDVVDFIGACPALGLREYYGANGHTQSVHVNDAGEYEVEVPASANPNLYCEMTFAYKDANGNVVYAQYGSVSDEIAGDYRECGTRSGVFACGMFFKPVTGHMPAPLNSYPN
jgi:hypothetical protein